MNIQEAIKSGKPFKRKAWTKYIDVRFEELVYSRDFDKKVWLYFEDVVADDWEVKEEKFTLDLTISEVQDLHELLNWVWFGNIKELIPRLEKLLNREKTND